VLFPIALIALMVLAKEPVRTYWRGLVPYVSVIAVFLVTRFLAFGNPIGGYGTGSGHTSLRPDLFLSSTGSFLARLLQPVVGHLVFVVVLLASAALCLVLSRGREPAGRPPAWRWIGYFALFWFALFLLPTHNLVFTPRHMYLSFAGIAVAAGLLLSRVFTGTRLRGVLEAGTLAGIVLLCVPPTLAYTFAYARKARECETALSELRTALATTPDGSVLVLVGFPQNHEPPWGFGWSLEDALGPPFLKEKLDRRYQVIVRRGWTDSAAGNYRRQFPDAPIRVLRFRPELNGIERILIPDEEALPKDEPPRS
jgi:hypothetical protein